MNDSPTPPVGQLGLYCVYCNSWKRLGELLPLRGKRSVKAPTILGQDVGRCIVHQAKHLAPVVYVRRDSQQERGY